VLDADLAGSSGRTPSGRASGRLSPRRLAGGGRFGLETPVEFGWRALVHPELRETEFFDQ
jgi:hypothetical protein